MNKRYVLGRFDEDDGIWFNYDSYNPNENFVIDNLFVYCDNNCVKNKWCWGDVYSFQYRQAMKVLE